MDCPTGNNHRSGEGADHRAQLGLVDACLYLWQAFRVNGVLQRQFAGAGKVEEVSVLCNVK